MSRQVLEQELSKIEKPAGIANPKDFRFEVVKFSLRARSKNGGKNPNWTSYEKIRDVIERRMFSQVEDLLPVISFGKKQDSETEKKHEEFVHRMVERGTRPPGAPLGGVVHAGEEVELIDGCAGGAPYATLTRCGGSRLPPRSRVSRTRVRKRCSGQGRCRSSTGASIRKPEPRQPPAFLRRAKAEIREAIKDSLKSRKVAEAEGAEKVTIGRRACASPPSRSGATPASTTTCCPATRSTRSATRSRNPGGGGGRGSQGSPDGEGQDEFTFTLTKESSWTCSSTISSCPTSSR